MVNFLYQYLDAPQNIRDFIYSNEFYEILNEYLNKFEITKEKETEFVYLLQDLVLKIIVPKSIMELKDEIVSRLNLKDEIANQIAYILFNRFLTKINQLWIEGESKQKEKEISPELRYLIEKIEEIKKKTKPTKIINLQKVILPKEKKSEVAPAINLQKPEETKLIKIQIPKIKTEDIKPKDEKLPSQDTNLNIQIPKISSEGLTSWQKKDQNAKEEEKESSNIIIIKKERPQQKNEESAIDLSSY